MSATYRSIFSGPEIDEAIALMKAKAGLVISNDFNGGIDKVASAELAKTLNQKIEDVKDPEFIREIIDALPDGHLLTNLDQQKLNYIKSGFRGLFITNSDRDTSTFEESANYIGNEFCIVINNGEGVSEINRWDIPTMSWKPIKISGGGDAAPVTVATASTVSIQQFSRIKYGTMKCIVSATNAGKTQRQVQEVVVTVIGNDTYISVFGDVGNASLFNLNATLTGDLVELKITTLASSLTVASKQLAVF